MVQTRYNSNGTRVRYRVKMQNACICVSPHIATRVSFCSNIISTNLRTAIIHQLHASIQFIYPFYRPFEYAK